MFVDRRNMVRRPVRWLLPALVVLAWLALSAPLGPLGGRLGDVQTNDSAAFLPDSAESTRAAEVLRTFDTERSLPVVLLWESDGGPLDAGTLDGIAERVGEAVALAEEAGALNGAASPPVPSKDGEAVQAVLPFSPDLGDALGAVVEDLRALPAVDGTTPP